MSLFLDALVICGNTKQSESHSSRQDGGGSDLGGAKLPALESAIPAALGQFGFGTWCAEHLSQWPDSCLHLECSVEMGHLADPLEIRQKIVQIVTQLMQK